MISSFNRFVVNPAIVVAAALLCACGGHPVRQVNPAHVLHNLMAQDAVTVNVGALGNSGQWGTASIGDQGHGALVLVRVHREPKGRRERAFLAQSSCTPPSQRAWKPLSAVVNGKSRTFVPGLDIGAMKKAKHAVVVESGKGGPVACGDFEM